MTNLIRKHVVVDEHNPNAVVGMFGDYTITFLADIPRNALVTSVLVNGLHLKSVKNIEEGVYVDFYRDDYYDGKRIVAVYNYTFDNNPIANLVKNYMLNEFVVEYIETAVAEL